MSGAILICGTHSDAGKSAVAAGICRWLAERGVSVAPFKAQNMSLNSTVTADGREIARSQAMQAAAAGIEPEAAMNPILLKPSGVGRSQVVVMGRPLADTDAATYQQLKARLREAVLDALADLRRRYEVVVCEGAGSPAEVNLRAGDLVNLGLARAAALPALLVGDIDRGGVFASLIGTLAVLDPVDQAHLAAVVINKFRGERALLDPGLRWFERASGRPVLGVLPWREGLWVDAEDSLALESEQTAAEPALGQPLEVAVLRLHHISNFTDLDALRCEPGVSVRFTRSPAELARADLVVIPGTKASVADLEDLRAAGLEGPLQARAAAGRPILGICGGYQMLGRLIEDPIESRRGRVDGLGLLPVSTRFESEKLLRRRSGRCPWLSTVVGGYEIRHGRVRRHDAQPLLIADDGEPEGCRHQATLGLSWHGALEHDGFRRALLAWVKPGFVPGAASFAQVRERRLARLGELVGDNIDTARLAELIEGGVPAGLPTLSMRLLGSGVPTGREEQATGREEQACSYC